MAKWADKKPALSDVAIAKEEPLPQGSDRSDGGPGNQNEARLALMDTLADQADEVRKESLEDVTTESYDDQPGTGEVDAAGDTETEEASEPVREAVKETPEPRKFKLKINGSDQEVTEEELIARAQKVSAADQYLAEASKLYAEAAKHSARPSEDDAARVEEDDLAIARAIQMGTEEEALKAIKSLKNSQRLSTDDVSKIIDSRFDQRMSFQRDLTKFQTEYKDLLSDDNAKSLVFELDELYNMKGEAPGYDRFKRAAETVKKSLNVQSVAQSMDEKEQRKASVRVVTGGGARQPARAEEREPTTSEVIANIAKARGQFVASGGH